MATAKTVLITGCSTGSIGEALAKEFRNRGYHVIATARSLTRLSTLKPLGIQTEELDVTSQASIQSLRNKITKLDILINNAGGYHPGMISDLTEPQWQAVFAQNFFSVVNVTHAFLPLLLESRGTVVNHTSQNPYFAFPGCALYACSKAAVRQYTDNLRIEMHPFSVRVVELITGFVSSNIVTRQMPGRPGAVPESSIYFPIKDELKNAWAGGGLQGKATPPDEYAKKVVSDLIDPPGWFGPWIWRGWSATTSYWVWLLGCGWKGAWDPVWRMGALALLKGRLEKEKQV
ncbi:NAD(P)-binding protein [Lophiostoma macrostomum CBS 122681]|uniref:NAD(P)-binding protein n=1 Tax=Lophiostoma macrostomum CBS 122681 TaxID=1314788 RepID=A0A6A6T9W6_9PLEO|nr:NAD(P)-binding protein [Lophiostoma macrostomum CBS 122681]